MEAPEVNYQQLAVYQVGRLQENQQISNFFSFACFFFISKYVLGHATQFYTGPRDFDIPGGDFFIIIFLMQSVFFSYNFSYFYLVLN